MNKMFHGTKKTSPNVSNIKSKFENERGRLHYKISYEAGTQTLSVLVVECQHLPKMDVMGSIDPFVRVYLLPGQHKELKTKVKNKNQNPVYNETFKFAMPRADMESKTVVFQIFDFDRFSKNDAVGEVQVPLGQLNLSIITDEWRELHAVTGKPGAPVVMQERTMVSNQSFQTSQQRTSMSSRTSSTSSLKKSTSPPPLVSDGRRRSRSSSSSSSRSSAKKSSATRSSASKQGRIHYKISYDKKDQMLSVVIVECQGLPKADLMGSIDPYVRVYMLPGQHKEIKTSVKNNNQNPVFNEVFKFGIPAKDVDRKTIVLQLFDHDKFSKNDAIGEVQISLWTLSMDFVTDEWRDFQGVTGKPGAPVIIHEKPLAPIQRTSQTNIYSAQTITTQLSESRQRSRSSSSSSSGSSKKNGSSAAKNSSKRGRVHYKISYDQKEKMLSVVVVECQGLPKADLMGSIDPYVRIYMMPGQHKEIKTSVKNNNQNPVFNEVFKFGVSELDVDRKTIILQLFDHDKFSKNDAIGEVQISLWTLNMQAVTDEWREFQDVTGKPGAPVILHEKPLAPVRSSSQTNVYSVQATTTQVRQRSKSTSSSSSSSDEDKSRRDNLGLKELNDRLIKYVDQVHLMQQNQAYKQSVSVSVDRTEINGIKAKYEEEIELWKKKYERSEADHHKTRIELGNITNENKRLKDSLMDKAAIIADKEKAMEALRAELVKVRAELSHLTMEREQFNSRGAMLEKELATLKVELEQARIHLDKERMRSGELETKLHTLQQEFAFKISILEKELQMERSKVSVDVSSVDGRLQVEYEARLKAELKKLRKMYEEQIKISREEFMMVHSKKIAELERQLAYEQRSHSSSSVEVKELHVRIEGLKRKISEIEELNLSLGRKNSELHSSLEEQATMYKAQLSARDAEIEFLKKEIRELREEYDRIYGLKMQEMAEVKVYSEVLVPELERMIKYSSRHASRGRKSSSSSSSSDEEKKKHRRHSSQAYTSSHTTNGGITTTRTARSYSSQESSSFQL